MSKQKNEPPALGVPEGSASWQFRSQVEWTPLREWHPAFIRSWWLGGQIGEYANNAYTIGFRVCGLFVGFWVYLPNDRDEQRHE
jgi:hypothetical protein